MSAHNEAKAIEKSGRKLKNGILKKGMFYIINKTSMCKYINELNVDLYFLLI